MMTKPSLTTFSVALSTAVLFAGPGHGFQSMTVDSGRCPTLGLGYACSNFGIVRIPRDVGFRFRYSPQGSPIAAGMSAMKNFTWTE